MNYLKFIILIIFILPTLLWSQNQQITVICTNDLHGALEPLSPDWADDNLVGGINYVSGYVNVMKGENPDGWLLLDAGDVFAGTFISYAFRGRSVIDCYNVMGYNAIAVGNHEFDWGVDTLVARINDSNCPFLAANIVYKENDQAVEWAKPYTIVTRNNIKIGIIGLANERTSTLTNPVNVTELEFTDAYAAAVQYADSVEAKGATLIIILAHIGGYQDYFGEIGELANQLDPNRFDLIIGGHVHSRLDDIINGIPVLENYANSIAIGRIDFWVDPGSGEVVSFDMNEYPTFTYHTYGGQPAEYHNHEIVPDSEVDQIYQSYKSQLDAIQNQVIGHASIAIGYANGPEWPIGNLITDAVRACSELPENVPRLDFAMTNNGSIRTDFPEGPITYGKIFQVFPFDNYLVILPLRGDQLEEIIEDMLCQTTPGNQISGCNIVFDPTKPDGSRVDLDDITNWRTGTPIHADSTYYLAVPDYLYNVNTLMQEIPRIDTPHLYRELIVNYIAANSPLSVEVEGRISMVTVVHDDRYTKPESFRLEQNYPNPFNPKTSISWQLAVGSDVELSIYNILGEKVVTLISGEQKAGFYTIEWDAGHLSSGVYYYILKAGGFQDVKKMVLVR
jgi:2',3'-cyclic-nucleotide 2'-phosphodiesterase/3'-nucleotidase